MAGKLEGKTIAFLATAGVEQVERTEPWKAVEEFCEGRHEGQRQSAGTTA